MQPHIYFLPLSLSSVLPSMLMTDLISILLIFLLSGDAEFLTRSRLFWILFRPFSCRTVQPTTSEASSTPPSASSRRRLRSTKSSLKNFTGSTSKKFYPVELLVELRTAQKKICFCPKGKCILEACWYFQVHLS